MTRDEAKKLLNCSKFKDLAAMLEITAEAISQWNPEEIPKLREFQVREKALELKLAQQGSHNVSYPFQNNNVQI